LIRAGDRELDNAIRDLLGEEPQRDPYKRFTILAYQLADVGRSMRYMLIYKDKTEAYRSYLKTGLSDLLVQVLIMARLHDFDTDELLKVGIARLKEYKLKGEYQE